MRRLRVLVLMHPDFMPPDSTKGYSAREINEWKTEYDIVSTLRDAGHDVRPLGVQEEIKPVRDEIETFKPHVVFTLLEEFHYEAVYDQHIASYLELMLLANTGALPQRDDLDLLLLSERAGDQSAGNHSSKAVHREYAVNGQAGQGGRVVGGNLYSGAGNFALQRVEPRAGLRTDGNDRLGRVS